LLAQYETQLNEKNNKLIFLQIACDREREKLRTELANNQIVTSLKSDCSKYETDSSLLSILTRSYQTTTEELRTELLKCKEQNEYLTENVDLLRNQGLESNTEREAEKMSWEEEKERMQARQDERTRSLERIIAEQREEANASKQTREELMEEFMKMKLEKGQLRKDFDLLRTSQDGAVERIAEQAKSLTEGENNSRALSIQIQLQTEEITALSDKVKEAQSRIESNSQQLAFERENFASKLKEIEEEKEGQLKMQKENAEMFYQYEKERLVSEKNAESETASLKYVCFFVHLFVCFFVCFPT
jgi:hypothetical protein